MPKVVRFHQIGGPEVLKLEDLPLAEPGKGEIRIKGGGNWAQPR